jgi:hypothetical protein
MNDEVPFLNLPDSCFPFTIAAYPADQADDVNALYEQTVTGPGALTVPALRSPNGSDVRVVIRFANGTQERLGDPA